jgi:crossover junction endodeoxyribonuclease RuvC
MRILSLDLSITSPGFAVIDVKKGAKGAPQPKLKTTAHFRTDASTSQALRYEEIEAFTLLFVREHMPFDVITREVWPPSRSYAQNNKIHGSWSAVERALSRYNYEVDAHLTPSNVKKLVTGNGAAKKPEVADSVRKLLGLAEDYEFKTDDHSDACAIGLAYLIREKIIKVSS